MQRNPPKPQKQNKKLPRNALGKKQSELHVEGWTVLCYFGIGQI